MILKLQPYYYHLQTKVWVKVIFSEMCVKNSVHIGGVPGQAPLSHDQVPPWDQVHPLGSGTPPGARYTL